MAPSVANKLALLVWYLQQVRRGVRSSDPEGFNSLLDDTEINDWMERMNKAGRIVNNRFTMSKH